MFANGRPFMLVLADGLGGHPAGRAAAAHAVAKFLRLGAHPDTDALQLAAQQVHEKLQEISVARRHVRCMGTVIAGCIIASGKALYFSCGDVAIFTGRGRERRVFPPDRSPSGNLSGALGGSFCEQNALQFLQEAAPECVTLSSDGVWEDPNLATVHDSEHPAAMLLSSTVKLEDDASVIAAE